MDPAERTLHPSRLKWALCLLGCLALMGIGVAVWAVTMVVSLVSLGLGGLGAIASAVAMLPGSSWLRLNQSGYEVRSLYRGYRVAWRDVQRFEVFKHVGAGSPRQVGVIYEPHVFSRGHWPRRMIHQVDAMLPDTYGMPARELAGMMNDYLRYYKGL